MADGSKTLKEFTESIDQEIFKDIVQSVRFDCFGENSYLIHSASVPLPRSWANDRIFWSTDWPKCQLTAQ
jgi:hypothetical protein